MDLLRIQSLERCPSAEKVACNLPHAFKIKYPTTYIITDASELFLGSCGSNYKQHNTSEYLVGVTPNCAVSYHLLIWDL